MKKPASLLSLLLALSILLSFTACSPVMPENKDFEGLSLTGTTVEYDGEPHTIALEGVLPEGATVSYTPSNTQTAVGVYAVVATVTADGYNTAIFSAILTITDPREFALADEVEVLIARLDDAIAACNGATDDKIASLRSAYDAKIAELSDKLAADTDALAALNDAYDAKVAILNAADAKNAADLAALTEQYETDLAILNAADAKNANDLATLTEQYETDLAILNAADKKNADDIAALTERYEADLAILNAAATKNADDIKNLTDAYNAKVALLDAADKKNADDLLKLTGDFNTKAAELNYAIAANTTAITSAKTELQAAIDSLQAATYQEISTLRGLIDALEAADLSNKDRIATLEAQVADILDIPRYTVSFDTAGAVENIPAQTVLEGKKATSPPTPTRDGYIFLGWYAGEEKWSFVGHTVTDDITLTAKWEVDTHGLELALTANGTQYTVTGYHGTDTTLEIPSAIGGIPVTRIAAWAFAENDALTSVVVPTSVTAIGPYAFYSCSSLVSITLPFVGTGDTKPFKTHFGAIFGASTYEENSSYVPSTLKHVFLEEGCTSVSRNAFRNCSIKSIFISKSVTQIYATLDASYGSFYGCSNVNFYCASDAAPSGWETGWNYGAPVTWGCADFGIAEDGLAWMNIGGAIEISDYVGTNVCVEIPAKINGLSVTSIASHAFSKLPTLKQVVIPSSVTTVKAHAFVECDAMSILCEAAKQPASWAANWNSINYPVEWGYIDHFTTEDGFSYFITANGATLSSYNGNATNIEIPATVNGYTVTTIGKQAFMGNTMLTSISIPYGVNTIREAAFSGCALTEVILPDSLRTIEKSAFKNCPMTEITVPRWVSYIGEGAFKGCNNLTRMTLPFAGESASATGLKAHFGHIFGIKTATSTQPSNNVYHYSQKGTFGYTYYFFDIPSTLKKVHLTASTSTSTGTSGAASSGRFQGCSGIYVTYENN